MRRAFSDRGDAIVAGTANADDLRVIHAVRWYERNVVVAGLAKITGLDMRQILADSGSTVVATDTIAGDVDVVKIGGHPAVRGVTVVASVTAGDMCRVFTGRDRTVVAGITGADDLGVIDHVRRYKLRRVMAVFAGVRRLNVCDWFSWGIHTVVAANAVAGNAGVIKNRRYPAIGLVTILALI
jgi:hypothetical protein